MNPCDQCKKNMPTVHVLDLEDGSLSAEHNLCQSCAESAGFIHGQPHTLKLTQQALQDLIGSFKGGPFPEGSLFETEELDTTNACPGCGMDIAEFKAKGRMGCARCYNTFRRALLPLLERVHDATSHRGRYPVVTEGGGEGEREASLRRLNDKLRAAIAAEDYESAANIRDEIQKLG